MKWILLPAAISLIIFSGCNLRQRENAIKKEKQELNEKERQLTLKEQELNRREDELNKKEHISDSIISLPSVDSISELHPKVPGTWNVKMVCSSTTCAGSAIGDTKTEKWNINFQGNVVIANVISDNKLVRVYVGGYEQNTLKLSSQPIDSTTDRGVKMVIHLKETDDGQMEGTREIIRPDCNIVYDLQLNKQ
ncbi:MAG: hypothetical protein ACTHNG_10580 [Ginsengibacter sp.]